MSPFTFLLTLFLIFYFTGNQAPRSFVMLVAWPGVIWSALVDPPGTDANLAIGLSVIAICNMLVYGAIFYVILTGVSVIKPRKVVMEPPPTPQQFDPEPPSSV